MMDTIKISMMQNRILNIVMMAFLVSLLVLPVQSLGAKKKMFPPGCRVMGFSFKHHALMLHPRKEGGHQSIYFIQNKSMHTIVRLYQMKDIEQPHNVQLNNAIRPNQWGVFASNRKRVRFACTIPNKKYTHGRVVNCDNYLRLCEYPNVKFAINNHGNYWSVISSSRRGAINRVVYQGILLKW